jgi:3-oxoacyl-[acyl-carrier-protein] synthase-3
LKGLGLTIIGSGSAVPTQILTNQDLSIIVETSDDWIETRTGMKERYISKEGESLSDLSAKAATLAISMASLNPEDIDLIVLATSTPDDLFGSACQVQKAIGATRAVAFDLTAACSGFVFALTTAAQFIRQGVYHNVLVIGADVLSRWVDWEDRTTCVLFGDGAGAVVCQSSSSQDNLLGFEMCSDGTQNSSLNLAYQSTAKELTPNISINSGKYGTITMKGKDVYRFAVEKVPEVIEKALYRSNLSIEEVDWLILHQANQRIIDSVSTRLGFNKEKVISNISKYGNTSAASIPIALDESIRQGKIKLGDTIVISGFGAGLTWASAVFNWGK